jgi:hypothetical protein
MLRNRVTEPLRSYRDILFLFPFFDFFGDSVFLRSPGWPGPRNPLGLSPPSIGILYVHHHTGLDRAIQKKYQMQFILHFRLKALQNPFNKKCLSQNDCDCGSALMRKLK